VSSLHDLPIIDAEELAGLLPYLDLVDALEAGHRSRPAIVQRAVCAPDGSDQAFLALPAWQPADAIGVKLVTVFPSNRGTENASVQALFVLFDGTNGRPVALIDGTELTYRKTAADSALGARFLARDDATTLLMVGAGGLAPHLIAAHRAVRPSIEQILIWNRTPSGAEALARVTGGESVTDLASAVVRADVICTATMTKEPLVHGRWLRAGTHLDLVGAFQPDHREVDDECVVRAALYVDHRLATLSECGDLVIPLRAGLIGEDDIRGDLYELCRAEVTGRVDAEQVTLFENGGGGHLDLMAAQLAWRRYSRQR
jgi:ornithine cyclodeaminase/alanine dehydrogenase-like protein (mu-crystallin family)